METKGEIGSIKIIHSWTKEKIVEKIQLKRKVTVCDSLLTLERNPINPQSDEWNQIVKKIHINSFR